MQKNGDGWRAWNLQVLLLIVGGLIAGIAGLGSYINNLQTSHVLETIKNNEETRKTERDLDRIAFNRLAEKTETICTKVSEHDTLLKLPFDARLNYYKTGHGRDK